MQIKLVYSIVLLFLWGNLRAQSVQTPTTPTTLQPSQFPQPPDTIGVNIPDEEKTPIELEEVIVRGDRKRNIQMKSAQNIVRVDKSYIEENFSGSLMQSLEKIPGVRAMTIGSGQSKPAIRGLGFNRMIVTENGIKHEGQQWGEDHGLEIDQFSVDEVEIVKGPGSLLYGSDAIGGAIQLRNNYIPTERTEGNINLYGRSNNESMGVSGQVAGRIDRWYYKVNATYMDYADYKVPTDSIQYYSYYIRLKDRRLRNTAGRDRNAGVTLGFLGKNFRSNLLISNINTRSGFFADAHGLEVRLSDINYDRSFRDIDLPYHSVNHFKLVNNSVWRIGSVTWEGNIAFQKNLREELSEPVSHGYMPVPPNPMERKFDKNTYTATTLLRMPVKDRLSLQGGFSMEHQHNKRGGWGFVIPDFRTTSVGMFVYGRYHISDDLILSTGVRADKVKIHIDSYRDWYETPDEHGNLVHKERAADLRKKFGSFTWSTGLNYQRGEWMLKANIGKSFRAPTPKELGSDGVNYHIFRYERGDYNLQAEEAYQMDMGISWQNSMMTIQWEPFLNYFPNYIYLNPTPEYYEGLQMYHYAQARVIRYGFETDIQLQLTRQFTLGMQSEYLYAEQLSGDKKGYSLPFSPPWSANFSIGYHPGRGFLGTDGDILLEYKVTGSQERIVPPEEKTEGYQLLNLSLGRSWQIRNNAMKLRLQIQNLLNKRYYDHTGFYRLIGIPEPGRNISVMFGFTF
ncbi:TonB-dependent receptor [uncultured Proteiniphilum sp.]|uniref:TonB-dependent receptor n=1 Tax=uncultured Proteiniphilum sp. TaxID=497637 RepID=UPI0026018D4F|nr:TonB-dependent receptor [uncultured Proteiniphilum sp.]